MKDCYRIQATIKANELKSDYSDVVRVSFRNCKWSQAGWKAFPKFLVLGRR